MTTQDVLPPAAFSTPAGADPLRYGVISDFVRAYDGNTDAYTVVSGNLADELYATDTFDGRFTVNSRKSIEVNPEMETEYRYIQQANVGASTAAVFLATSVPTQKWQRGEMYMLRGYTEIFLAEAWCSGSAISGVGHSTPAKLDFSVVANSQVAGSAVNPGAQVSVEDAAGIVVASATNSVTLSLASGPAGGTLSGTTTVSAVGGHAVFTALTLSTPGLYTLSATSTGLTASSSNTFSVVAPPTASVMRIP